MRIENPQANACQPLSYAKFTQGAEVSKGCSKVLSFPWNYENDVICFNFAKIVAKAQEVRPTKRNVLSALASMFDPLGIISPVIVYMKMLFQELCRDSIGWNDELKAELKKKWSDWIVDLSRINGIAISRCIYDSPKQEEMGCYLHGFGDASDKAYCAVVYFVYRTRDGVHVRLLPSRLRVGPLKALKIPRL